MIFSRQQTFFYCITSHHEHATHTPAHMSATAASNRQTALRKAEKLRKQLRRDVIKIKEVVDIRNKYSLTDANIVRLLPAHRASALPRRKNTTTTTTTTSLPPQSNDSKRRKQEREAALRSGRRLATELSGLETRRPVQLLLLKCSAVIVHDALVRRAQEQQLETQRNTKMIMCMPPAAREQQRILEVAYDKQAYALALKEGMGAGRFDHVEDDDATQPLPLVQDVDQYGRFTFDELSDLFPILAHNSQQELGRAIEQLEAQKLILRDHGKNSAAPHLNHLPLTAEIPAEYVHGGRQGMRLWMEQTVPKVFGNKPFLKALDQQRIQSLGQLTQMDPHDLATLVTIGLNAKKKGTRRRQDELAKAVSGLRIGMRGDYGLQRRSVRFRYSKRTGTVLYSMLLRGLSEANSSIPGTNSHCSGCRHGLVAHNWDCGQSQMELLQKRLLVSQEQRAHRPLPRSDDGEMAAELTWYEALRKRLHLHRGWGFGANPKNTIVPTATLLKRKQLVHATKLLAREKVLHDSKEWTHYQDNRLRTDMRSVARCAADSEQRFVTSPRIVGAQLQPIPTRYAVWVKPETATQAMGRRHEGSSKRSMSGGLFAGLPNWNHQWSRVIVPPKFEIVVKEQVETLRVLSTSTDPLLNYLKRKGTGGRSSSFVPLGNQKGKKVTRISQTLLEFDI